MGDFNAIRHVDDRMIGSLVQTNEIVDFNEFIRNANLMELKAVGREFTWTNNHVYSRIDRGLVNSTSCAAMEQFRGSSDGAEILGSFSHKYHSRRKALHRTEAF